MIFELVIFPLIILFQSLFELINYFVGSYGWSLLGLSLATTLISQPLNDFVGEIVERERLISSIISPQIEKIKKEYFGKEKHEAIGRVYYRYRYNPVFAIRSSFGVMIQLPFLLGAYWMLSNYDPLKGQSFLLVDDLFQPDGLGVFDINILPIAMTVINIVTIKLSDFQKKESFQLVIVSIVFFLLLYSAPSALLLYWTMNNLISLIKVLLKYWKFNGEKA